MALRDPWFGATRAGGVMPMPIALPGWIAFLAFLLLIAATVALKGGVAWAARLLLVILYMGLAYAKKA